LDWLEKEFTCVFPKITPRQAETQKKRKTTNVQYKIYRDEVKSN